MKKILYTQIVMDSLFMIAYIAGIFMDSSSVKNTVLAWVVGSFIGGRIALSVSELQKEKKNESSN